MTTYICGGPAPTGEEAHCTGCHETFQTDEAFFAHQPCAGAPGRVKKGDKTPSDQGFYRHEIGPGLSVPTVTKKRPKTASERQREHRQRKRQVDRRAVLTRRSGRGS